MYIFILFFFMASRPKNMFEKRRNCKVEIFGFAGSRLMCVKTLGIDIGVSLSCRDRIYSHEISEPIA